MTRGVWLVVVAELILGLTFLSIPVGSFFIPTSTCPIGSTIINDSSSSLHGAVGRQESTTNVVHDANRRRLMEKSFVSTGAACLSSASAMLIPPLPAIAASSAGTKSRTVGYAVQRTEKEWATLLSASQYDILRRGGTERQRSSVLDLEDRRGTYVCAGCNTSLFAGGAKFKSGTGWPSFATALDVARSAGGTESADEAVRGVEVVLKDGYSEARCGNCGGHLGDVFNDGWRFVGTPASKTGKRYCIDGAALVFKPEGAGNDVVGDRLPPNKVIMYEPVMYKERPVT